MKVDGVHYRTIWTDAENRLHTINQLKLPFSFEIAELPTFQSACEAISHMLVRGAGLIGATAGYGMWLAAEEILHSGISEESAFAAAFRAAGDTLKATRPTAKNLAWAVDRQIHSVLARTGPEARRETARQVAESIADEDAAACRKIGEYGLEILRRIYEKSDMADLQILTHCNAGWLAFVDYGSALAPIYAAHDAGLPVHVWVDETRPRNQGASLTAWELQKHGVPHDIIADNTGGLLLANDMVDVVITGADRVTRGGDVANKVGTYLKALAAADNFVPFYVALPSSTFDPDLLDGRDIPIEERGPEEVLQVHGLLCEENGGEPGAAAAGESVPGSSEGLLPENLAPDSLFAAGLLPPPPASGHADSGRAGSGRTDPGRVASVRIAPKGCTARNWAFDITPARLVTGLITERGVCPASEAGISGLFPELFHD